MQRAYPRQEIKSTGENVKIYILQAQWHTEYTDVMVEHCREVLGAAGVSDEQITVYQVPGALELPLAAQVVAESSIEEQRAIICFGAIVRGETAHFDLVAQEATRGLGAVSLKYNVPVIQEVLAVENLEQLAKRTADNQTNKGREAALAALQMLDFMGDFT